MRLPSLPRDARTQAAGVAFAAVSATGFATLGLFAKLIYSRGFTVLQALSWRFTVAAAALWIYLAVSGTLRIRAGKTRRLLLLGIFGFAPQAGLFFATVRILDPGIASLLLYLYPSFVILLSLVFLRRKPTGLQLVALGLSLSGCALTLWKSGSYPPLGLALGVLVALSYGGYLVVGEKALEGADPIYATAVIMAVSAAIYWIAAIAVDGPAVPTDGTVILGIAGVAFAASILPIVTLFASIKRIGASEASLVSTVEPVLTVALSALIIGERLGAAQAAGGVLIVAAVVVMNLKTPNPPAGKGA
ncbi:MAG: DMT family transporter [Spirochaetes bacterium]|nr:DMT family transporter [Spirochaetota bacterium]